MVSVYTSHPNFHKLSFMIQLIKSFDNITDIFNRLYLQSSPVIRAAKPKKQTKAKKLAFIYPEDEILSLMLIRESDLDD